MPSQKELYKTENNIAGYESTLFHTKQFWEKSGFKWEDIKSEAVSFYYNKGIDRVMENYYDTIKLLSIRNMNEYQPVKITLENMKINIPDFLNSITINDHPLKYQINDLFFNQKIQVLSIHSEIVPHLKNNLWEITTIKYDKKKEKELSKLIQEKEQNYDLCFINTKFPIWTIFSKKQFNCIVFESDKNIEQMDSILKKNNYLKIENLYIHKNYLI